MVLVSLSFGLVNITSQECLEVIWYKRTVRLKGEQSRFECSRVKVTVTSCSCKCDISETPIGNLMASSTKHFEWSSRLEKRYINTSPFTNIKHHRIISGGGACVNTNETLCMLKNANNKKKQISLGERWHTHIRHHPRYQDVCGDKSWRWCWFAINMITWSLAGWYDTGPVMYVCPNPEEWMGCNCKMNVAESLPYYWT